MAACLRCGRPGVTSYCRTCQPRKAPTAARGYGSRHQAVRRTVQAVIDRGEAYCTRCNGLIHPGEPWDLDHDDLDRGVYRGPSHASCNRSAGGTNTNKRSRNFEYGASRDPRPSQVSNTPPGGICG